MKQGELREYAESFERLLRLKTYPLAIKMLESEDDIPDGAKRPSKDYGFRFLACQGFSESRKAGITIAQLKEDMWCFEAALGFGLIEPIEFFLEGNTRFPEGASSMEAGKTWAHAFPRFEYDKYAGILSAPLANANFEPDLVLIYCDSAQLKNLLTARAWIDGQELTVRISGMGACVYSVVPTLDTGECKVACPCAGERNRAFSQDDEMIFSAPIGRVPVLVEALKAMDKYNVRIPLIPNLVREPMMRPSYTKAAHLAGLLHD